MLSWALPFLTQAASVLLGAFGSMDSDLYKQRPEQDMVHSPKLWLFWVLLGGVKTCNAFRTGLIDTKCG